MEALQKKRIEWERQNTEVIKYLIQDLRHALAQLFRGTIVALNLFVYLLYGLSWNFLNAAVTLMIGPQLKIHISPERPPEEFNNKKWIEFSGNRIF